MKTRILYITLLAAVPFLMAGSCGVAKKSDSEKSESVQEEASQDMREPKASSIQEKKDTTKTYMVLIKTSMGDMKVKLYNETPLHRDNFIKLAKSGFYKDLLFHRVIKNFMIQGGDPNSRGAAPGVQLGSGGPGYTVPAEFRPELFHKKGALSAARMGDQMNPTRASSGSQFYIVQGSVYPKQDLMNFGQQRGIPFTEEQLNTYSTVGGTPHLDLQYTVFGEVVEGLDVIDKIAAVQTQRDRPLSDVTMDIVVLEE